MQALGIGTGRGANTGAPIVKRRVVGLGRSLLVQRHHAPSAAVGLGSARTRRPAPKRTHPNGLSGGPASKAASHPESKPQGEGRGAGSSEGGVGVSWKFAPRGSDSRNPIRCDWVLRSARGSLQVLAPSDQGLQPLRRWNQGYVSSEPGLRLVRFLSMLFCFLPWLHRALSCSVLLLMRRLHLFVRADVRHL